MNSDPEVHEIAFQYGKNVGIAFQVRAADLSLLVFKKINKNVNIKIKLR